MRALAFFLAFLLLGLCGCAPSLGPFVPEGSERGPLNHEIRVPASPLP
jgi:hypothetical protein